MSLFTPRLISTDNWNQLVFNFPQFGYSQFDNEVCYFPDDRLLSELLFPWSWNPPDRYNLKKYLNPRTPSENSLHLCQSYSNCAVNHILLRYSDPSQSIRLSEKYLRNICENHSIPYEHVELSYLMIIYLEWIYSPPIDFKKSWYSVTPFSSVMKVEDITSETAKKALDKHNRWGNMLASRFPLWVVSFEISKKLYDEMKSSDEYQCAIKTMVEHTDSSIKKSRKLKNKQKGLAKGLPAVPDIRQCWFCGEFRLSPRSQNNNYSRYCDDLSCKRSHKAWVTYLDRQGESPASLGL